MARYKSLLTVTAKHTYYDSGFCPDLIFTPLPETVIALRRQRSFIKYLPCGFQVVTQIQPDESPIIRFDEGLKLYFTIQAKDAALFFGVTDLDQSLTPGRSFSGGCKMYFRNNGSTLEYRVLDTIVPKVYELRFSMESMPSQVSAQFTDEDGNTVNVEYQSDGTPVSGPYILTADPDNGSFLKKLDLSGVAEGPFTAVSTNTSDATDKSTLNLYLHNELWVKSCAGVLELNVPAFTGTVNTTDFLMSFISRSSDWQYLVINRSGLALNEVDLVITDTSGDDGSGLYDEYDFDGNPVGSDSGDQPDQTTVDGYTAQVFTSTSAIPFHETSKTGLELKSITEGDPVSDPGNVLISDLPNPDPRFSTGDTSTIHIYI